MNDCKKEDSEMKIARIAEWIAEKRQDLFISEIKERLKYMKSAGYNLDNKSENPNIRLEICNECGFFINPNLNVNKSNPDLPIICVKCNKTLKIWGVEGKLRSFFRNGMVCKIEGFQTILEALNFIEYSKEPIIADVIISHDLVEGYIIVEPSNFIFPFGSLNKDRFFEILKEFD